MKAANDEQIDWTALVNDHNEAVRQRQKNNFIFQCCMYVIFLSIGFMGAQLFGGI